MRRYVLLKSDDEEPGFTVEVPSLPGCITEGDTVEEALAYAREAITLYVEGLIERGSPLPMDDLKPQSSRHQRVALVQVDLPGHARYTRRSHG